MTTIAEITAAVYSEHLHSLYRREMSIHAPSQHEPRLRVFLKADERARTGDGVWIIYSPVGAPAGIRDGLFDYRSWSCAIECTYFGMPANQRREDLVLGPGTGAKKMVRLSWESACIQYRRMMDLKIAQLADLGELADLLHKVSR